MLPFPLCRLRVVVPEGDAVIRLCLVRCRRLRFDTALGRLRQPDHLPVLLRTDPLRLRRSRCLCQLLLFHLWLSLEVKDGHRFLVCLGTGV